MVAKSPKLVYAMGMNTNEKPAALVTFRRPGNVGQISFEADTLTDAFAQFYRTFPGHGAVVISVQSAAAASAKHEAERAALAALGID